MQQGGGSHSHSRLPAAAHHHGLVVEEASPISSRPPAPDNLEQLMPEIDAFTATAAEDADRGGEVRGVGGGGGGGGGGNRWPRQETVALLKIRSDMDAAFKDASLKGPLWEDVSRKMAEFGYKRSAKKCKEKFENVHKYYKRTKEGRAGRQDGKTYKFFSELEALQAVISPGAGLGSSLPFPQPALAPPPVIPSLQPPQVPLGAPFGNPIMPVPATGMQPPTVPHFFPGAAAAAVSSPLGLIFSSNSSSLSPGSDDDEDDEEDVEGEPSTAGSSRKRKRAAEMPSASEGRRMMEYFEGLMNRVMQKQEEMQKRFLEALEKREQDRLAREEAWRRQEMYRLARERELVAQERAVTASRDAAIMSFLQKITGQTIQFPTTATLTSVPVASPRAPLPPQAPAAASPPSRTQPQQPTQWQQPPQTYQPTAPFSREVIAAIPEQQVPPPQQEIIGTSGSGGVGGSGEVPSSSRWPKTEVLALIRLRSGMESKYQESVPKGPLWEEISAGMHRLGYKRNPKRCKEKWENINKYFKKVKESNKKRPEDAKTCPYFHELDALYRKKVLSGGQSSGCDIRSDTPTNAVTEEAQRGSVIATADLEPPKNGGPDDEETEGAKKPEDTVKEKNQCSEQQQARVVDFGDKADDEADNDDLDRDDNEDELDDDDDEGMEAERKMAYKIEYQQQRPNSGTPNGGGSGSAPSFATMVQ